MSGDQRIGTTHSSHGSASPLTLSTDELAYVGETSRRVGFTAAMIAMRVGGEDMARAAGAFWKHPRYAELEQRREPSPDRFCPVRCRRCSRCICAEGYERRGGPFLGLEASAA